MKIIDQQEFQDLVLGGTGVTLVDFFATWCGPCKMLAPVLEEVSKELEGKADIYKVDIDQNRELALKYNIVSVPTMLIFKNGTLVDQVIGFVPKSMIVEKLNYFNN